MEVIEAQSHNFSKKLPMIRAIISRKIECQNQNFTNSQVVVGIEFLNEKVVRIRRWKISNVEGRGIRWFLY